MNIDEMYKKMTKPTHEEIQELLKEAMDNGCKTIGAAKEEARRLWVMRSWNGSH